MKNKLTRHILVFFLSWPLCFNLMAQETGIDTVDVREDKVRDLIAFLEFSLNTIGSEGTPPREKDVIITQSFNKIFRDADVQVEDDLDLNRSTVTNKDVQAYLKDIDFFFNDVTFTLEIEDIEQLVNDSSQVFYLVKLNRNLTGYTLSGDTVNQTITRFIEVNYDEEKDDLKIVSFYTTKLSEKEDLLNWWNALSFEWRYIFQNRLGLYDSVSYEDLKALVAIDSLNISSNHYLEDFEPLFKLDQLRYLDLSHTSINDLSPLRIHNKLEYIDLSHTNIENLEYLKYASNLQFLNASHSNMSDPDLLSNFVKLRSLNINECPIDPGLDLHLPSSLQRLEFTHASLESYRFLTDLDQIEYLDLSFSSIPELDVLAGMKRLRELYVESTDVEDLSPLENNDRLTMLNIESTKVSDLTPLATLDQLKKVFCDNSQVSKEHADGFMRKNPGTLVIFDSEELRSWWIQLGTDWRHIYMNKFGINPNPEKDELAWITQVDSIDLSGNHEVTDLRGLAPLKNLKYLDMHDTYIREINTLTTLPEIQYLDASFSSITSIDSINFLKNLTYLNLESTMISSIEPLTDLRALEYLNIEDTRVEEDAIKDFIRQNPQCLVIYRTQTLRSWWNDLSSIWRAVLLENAGMAGEPDPNALHKISYLNDLRIDSANIESLKPLNELDFLKRLTINRTYITSIDPIKDHTDLQHLSITQTPVNDPLPLKTLRNLEELNISNTGISDIEVLGALPDLQVLSVSGIPLKNLKALSGLQKLHTLDISNTLVRNLKHIESLHQLELLICYNTRLNDRKIEKFKSQQPDCKVVFY